MALKVKAVERLLKFDTGGGGNSGGGGVPGGDGE